MKNKPLYKSCTWLVLFSFLLNSITPLSVSAQQAFFLPNPTVMVTPTAAFVPPLLKGMKVDVNNPFNFDFILDSGNADLSQDELKQEADKLIKYFLASLTIPETDLWVNLSPYEKDRIIPSEFGITEMGRDLLAQDYILKQLTASLMYPEKDLGKVFWDKVYKKAQEVYGTTDVPVNTFNKVWIIPDKAVVYENEDKAFIVKSHLKVMLEEDYLAMKNNLNSATIGTLEEEKVKKLNSISSQMIKEIIIPEIEKEVNYGQNFAKLRQVYHSLILAKWYKESLKESIINREYSDQKKTTGVDIDDKQAKEKIYEQYLKAFKDGVYNYIKDEYDPTTQELIPRKYFSGGLTLKVDIERTKDSAMLTDPTGKLSSIKGVYGAPSSKDSNSAAGKAVDLSEPAQDYFKEQLIQSDTRVLLWTDNVDSLEVQLRSTAIQKGKQFLRVTLKENGDLNRLLNTIYVRNGKIQRLDGLLTEIIRNGGVLLIDYTVSDSKDAPTDAEDLNSLFDENPYFRDLQASKGLSIIGAIREDQVGQFPGSYYSRWQQAAETVTAPYQDPVEAIEDYQGGSFEGITVDLWGITNLRQLRNILIGTYRIDEQGNIHEQPGAMVEALRQGKQLLLRGGNWQDENLLFLMRQIFNNEAVEFNGESISLPKDFDQRIKRQSRDYKSGVTGKTLLAMGESKRSTGNSWVINNANVEILFGNNVIDDQGRITGLPGLLEQKQLRLKITDQLDVSHWHRIMHASNEIEIEVAPGVIVPSEYSSLRSEKLKIYTSKVAKKNLTDVKSEQIFVIESADSDLAYAQILSELAINEADVVRYPVTSQTGMSQLLDEQLEDSEVSGDINERKFKIEKKDVLTALSEGKIIVLEGLENNEEILRNFETALGENPYLVVNGQRLDFKTDLPGKLILITNTVPVLMISAIKNTTQISVDDQKMGEILAKEFQDKFSLENFDKILKLRNVLNIQIPSPDKTNLYPSKINFSLSRLRLLYEYFKRTGSWLKAVEQVILSDYAESPNVAAYIRTRARVIFNEDYPGQAENSIHAAKLNQALNMVGPGQHDNWKSQFWMFADALSLDLLQSAKLKENYTDDTSAVYKMIQKALVKQAANEKKDVFGEMDLSRERFYRERFKITTDINGEPNIDNSLSLRDMTWQEQKDRVIQALQITNGVMLKGSPGTGKSFITEQIAKELGYQNQQIVGPITVGSDTQETDIVLSMKTENGKTKAFYESVAQWAGIADGHEANQAGALLIVDEANIPKEKDFWNFLKGAFDQKNPHVWMNGKKYSLKNHKIIFTGNQETLVNRHFMDIISQHMITIDFKPFPREFMTERVSEYVKSTFTNREQLINLIVDLHFFFQKMDKQLDLSLRDVQELTARINTFINPRWSKEEIVGIAWIIYKGNFSEEEKKAFTYLIREKYGVLVNDLDQQRIADIQKKFGERFKKDKFFFNDSTAELTADIQDFLNMRQERVKNPQTLQGKRGMIIEGPSGQGKDVSVVKTLTENGFKEGSVEQTATNPETTFYRITASFDTDAMVALIKKAQREGSIVVISEMNRLPSGFLEGRLNDVLTGNAAPGFALFATINSVDFHGREKLSSALQNRVIYKRLRSYNQKELTQIAVQFIDSYMVGKEVSTEDIKVMVNIHLWLQNHIENKEHQPTPREFLRMLHMRLGLPSESPEKIAEEFVYQLYLQKFLKNQKLPSREELINYQEDAKDLKIQQINMMKKIAWYLVGDLYGEVDVWEDSADANDGGGYWKEDQKAIVQRSRGFINGYWENVMFHETSHARRTRSVLRSDFQQDMEDLRHEAGHRYEFEYSVLGIPSDGLKRFAQMAADVDIETFDEWMIDGNDPLTMRTMYQYTLWTYANTLLTPEHAKNNRRESLEQFAGVLDDVFAINPVRLALKHLDAARELGLSYARVNDEEERLYQQFRGDILFSSMENDYLSIPVEEQPEEILSEEEKEEERAHSAEAIRNLGEVENVEEESHVVQNNQPLTEAELNKKKQALADRLKRNTRPTEQKIKRILDEISKDLMYEYRLLDERLEEMLSLLENPSYQGNIVDAIHQIQKSNLESTLIGQVNRLKSHIRKVSQKRMQAANESLNQKGKSNSFLNKLDKFWNDVKGHGFGQQFGDGFGEGIDMGGMIGRRHGAGVHTDSHRASKYDPKPVTPPSVKQIKLTRSTTEDTPRQPRMAQVSETFQSELNQALDAFIQIKKTPGDDFGMNGVFDLEAYFLNPSEAHVSSSGVPLTSKKTIILTGENLNEIKWNPILDEALAFLFAQGFKFTVYTDAVSYVDEITTLADLKKAIQRSTSVENEAIKKDVSSRLQRDTFELVSLQDIQRKVEEVYTYGVMRSVILKENVGDESTEKNEKLSRQEQIDLAIKILKKLGITKSNLFMDTNDYGVTELSVALLEPTKQAIFHDIKHLTELETLDMHDTDTTDKQLEYLILMSNLKNLYLNGTKVTEDAIKKFIWQHKNRDNLTVHAFGKEITIKDVPDEYKAAEQKEELSLDEQVKLTQEILKKQGESAIGIEERISKRYDRVGFTLNLSNFDIEGLKSIFLNFNRLPNLIKLTFNGPAFTDAELPYLLALPNLKEVTFYKKVVSEDAIKRFIGQHQNQNNLSVKLYYGDGWGKNDNGTVYKISDVPEKYKTAGQKEVLSSEEQLDLVTKLLKNMAFSSSFLKVEARILKNDSGELEGFNLSDLVSNDISQVLSDVNRLTNLKYLLLNSIANLTDEHLLLLKDLENLEEINLHETQVSNEAVYKFIVQHKNRDNIRVTLAHEISVKSGKFIRRHHTIGITDVPDKYKTTEQKKELSVEEKIDLAHKILKDVGVLEKGRRDLRIGVNSQGELFRLSLSLFADNKDFSKILYDVARLDTLEDLTLQGTKLKLKGNDLEQINGLKKLTRLDITNTDVGDSELSYLNNKNLETMSLRGTKVSYSGLTPLLELPNLRYVDLSGTNVSEDDIKKFLGQHMNRNNLKVISASGKTIGISDVPDEYKTEEQKKPSSLKDQVTQIKELLRNLGIKEPIVLVEGGKLKAHIDDLNDNNIDQVLAGLKDKDLTWLFLGGVTITSSKLKYFNGLLYLENLYFSRSDISNEEIYKFIVQHPNQKLEVGAGGPYLTIDDVPDEYKTAEQEKPLTVEDMARQLLKGLDVADDAIKDRIIKNDKEEVIGVILSNLTNSNINTWLFNIRLLTTLEALYLDYTQVDDTSVKYLDLLNLKFINLTDTNVTDAALPYLNKLPNLGSAIFVATKVSDDAIKNFISQHENGDNLAVISSSGKLITINDVPEEYKTAEQKKPLTLDEQIIEARKVLLELNISMDRLHVNDQGELELDLRSKHKIEDNILFRVGQLTNLKKLTFSNNRIQDSGLKYLISLKKLETLDLHFRTDTHLEEDVNVGDDTQLTDKAIYEFIVQHPNRDNLGIIYSPTETITITDVPEEYKTAGQKETLSLDEQEEIAKKILNDFGVKDLEEMKGRINIRNDAQQKWISLDLSGLKNDQMDNKLSEISRLTDLKFLNLSGSSISNAGLQHVKGLTKLIHLELKDTNISDDGLEYLKELTFLKHLDLTNTKVTDAGLPSLSKLNLESLYLDGTKITEAGLSNLLSLKNLKLLFLEAGISKDAFLKFIEQHANQKNLEILTDSNTKLTVKDLPEHKIAEQKEGLSLDDQVNLAIKILGDLGVVKLNEIKERVDLLGEEKFMKLDLSGLSIDADIIDIDNILSDISRLTNLNMLNLSGMAVTNSGLMNLKGMSNLKELMLNDTMVSDSGLGYIKDLPNLVRLDLKGTNVTNDGLAHIKSLHKLGILNLRQTKVTDAGLVQIRELPNLIILILDGTNISDNGLVHLKGLGLSSLDLEGTKVTDVGLEKHLLGLPILQSLNFKDTAVSDDAIFKLIMQYNSPEPKIFSVVSSSGKTLFLDDVPSEYKIADPKETSAALDKRLAIARKYLENLGLNKNLGKERLTLNSDGKFVLDLDNSSLDEKIMDKIFVGLEQLSDDLEELYLYNVEMKNRAKHLPKLKNLKKLQYSTNENNDVDFKYLTKIKSLKELILYKENITIAGLKNLQYLENLEYLSVYATGFKDDLLIDFLNHHKNRDNLAILTSQGHMMTLNSEKTLDAAVKDLSIEREMLKETLRFNRKGEISGLSIFGLEPEAIIKILSWPSHLENISNIKLSVEKMDDAARERILSYLKNFKFLKELVLRDADNRNLNMENIDFPENLEEINIPSLSYLEQLETVSSLKKIEIHSYDFAPNYRDEATIKNNMERVYRSLVRHKNRDNLTIKYGHDVNQKVTMSNLPDQYKKLVEEERSKQTAEEQTLSSEETLLKSMLESLVQPDAVLKNVLNRFEADGLQDKAKDLIAKIGKEMKTNAIPGQDPTKDPSDQAKVPFGKYVSGASEMQNSDKSILGKEVGGIDFNPGLLDLEIQGKGQSFNAPNVNQNLQNIHIGEGLSPIIINITPITNLPLLLGATVNEEEMLSSVR